MNQKIKTLDTIRFSNLCRLIQLFRRIDTKPPYRTFDDLRDDLLFNLKMEIKADMFDGVTEEYPSTAHEHGVLKSTKKHRPAYHY